MEVLKRKNEIEHFKETEDSKRTKTEMRKNEDSSDSEGEEDLLQRLFGSSKPIQKIPESIEDNVDSMNEENETEDKEKEPEEVKEEDEECIWHDEDDDQVRKGFSIEAFHSS